MKPSARIQASIDLLERISRGRIPMDATAGDYFRVRKYIGAKDRANIAERVYAIMRAHARLGWWLERAGAFDSPRIRVIAWLALSETFDPFEIFTGEKHAPGKLDEAENALWKDLRGQSITPSDMPVRVRIECPEHYADSLDAYFGEAFESEMSAFMEPAPLDLRVNLTQAAPGKVIEFLEADGVKANQTPWSPWGLRCEGKAFLSRTKAFAKGWIEIQDEGSQLIAVAANPAPGMQVLDYCAGAGGKTLALANAMQLKGRIVAMDTEEGRLQKGRQRFRKSGVADIVEVRPLSDERHRKWLRRQKGTFDVTLVDVPCTGTGTWRRNPDMRWRTYGPSLEELTAIQSDILDRVAHTVKPGGRLVYATCSLLPEENERQVEAFLSRHEGYEILPVREAWPEGLPVPCEGDFMRLTPKRHNTDGFFAAILTKA
ncbi:MAG: RsmB/NOP family class I SAM-dependent RNA methyltransferase [Alphaproteobacteria bacterium]|nr:RsmB/NOP family class I SAM-dependent RNA methyltransferase [Alphaproteobacteria bacterium]